MAWRPHRYLVNGELDNTQRHCVTGWMRFAGLDDKVTFDLVGEFHRDIRGTSISLIGDFPEDFDPREAIQYMQGFQTHQTGKVGDITSGLSPQDYVPYPYIEWYSDQNGRVVLELAPQQLEVIGSPIPACEFDPVSWVEQDSNMTEFLYRLREELRSRPESGNHRQQPSAPRPEDRPSGE